MHQSDYMEERVVVNLALQVQKLIDRVCKSVDYLNEETNVWGEHPESYLKMLVTFAKSIEQDPTNT